MNADTIINRGIVLLLSTFWQLYKLYFMFDKIFKSLTLLFVASRSDTSHQTLCIPFDDINHAQVED